MLNVKIETDDPELYKMVSEILLCFGFEETVVHGKKVENEKPCKCKKCTCHKEKDWDDDIEGEELETL